MPSVWLAINLDKELKIKTVSINHNDTGMDNNSQLIKDLCFTLLKSMTLNKDDIQVQDLLNELGIKKSK